MALPINPNTGRMMADGCEWGPEDFAKVDPKQEAIFEEVLAERRRQDEQWGGPEHDDELDLRYWLSGIRDQSRRAAVALTTNVANNYRQRLVKIAALAVAAIESLDRKMGK